MNLAPEPVFVINGKLEDYPFHHAILDSPDGEDSANELAVQFAIKNGWSKNKASKYFGSHDQAKIHAGAATYPDDHEAAMRVPKGGSSCASCEYLEDGNKCNNEHFIKYHGSKTLPYPADEFCSDWYEPKSKIEAATETSLAGDHAGTLWNGIRLIGFTGPEEEGVRAMLSRIPPELLFNVKEIKSAKELYAKHGRFVPETQTILFNPANFRLRQRFGQGDGWLYHPELTAIHEVGHSIFESWTPEEKQKWYDVSGWMEGTKPGQVVPYKETRSGWTPGVSPWTHIAGLKTPRYYSTKNPNEHFADCFAYYILGRAYQMSDGCKEFLDQYFQDHVKNYTAVAVESPTKAYLKDPTISVLNKTSHNLYNNIEAGGPGSGRRKGPEKEKPLSDRAQRAKSSYVAQTKGKSRIARLNEAVVAKMVGGDTTGDNKPFDVLGKKFGIEVKTIFPGVKNEKLTMHPESLARKVKAAKQLKVKTYTVAIDMRNKNSVGVYFKKGLGSFRLGSMTDVGSFKNLKDYIQ